MDYVHPPGSTRPRYRSAFAAARATWILAALLAIMASVSGVAAVSPGETTADPLALLDRLEEAWKARDLVAYLELRDLPTADEQEEERDFARRHFESEATELRLQRPTTVPPGTSIFKVVAEAVSITEPRGRVEQWTYLIERGPRGWVIKTREPLTQIDGLVHLSLDPTGYRAEGVRLHLEDFELVLERGTLFTSPPSLGPTVLVFVGEATVTVSPRPATEREQLRQFCGKPQMVERVKAAFLRIHPADLHRVMENPRFEPDPEAPRRLEAAQRFYREQASRAFVLDASLPRSPWWLLPSLGDASVTFQTARRGTLTFTISSSEAEGISLFDRARRLQVCLYPAEGRDARYDEDQGRSVEVVHHDLKVRFEPSRFGIEGEDTLKLRLLIPTSTIRLRLEEGLAVQSIVSREGGNHLFFRVRHQNSLMVSLGALAGRVGEVSLTVRYAGFHPPQPIDREVIQVPAGSSRVDPVTFDVEEVPIEDVLVYTNRTAWYPQAGADDYARATLRFDVPQDLTVVAGGTRGSVITEGGRSFVEYHQDLPGKYITAAVGRLIETGHRRSGSMELHGFSVGRTRGESAQMLARAEDILTFYQESFGPCPYPSLNLVFIEGRTPGGHSPPGMVLLAQRPLLMRKALRDDPANFTDVPGFFLAHELAHQWWGHGIAGQNYRERWLSEAFAQYAAALWVQRRRGDEVFRDILGRMARWALRKTHEGPIHLGHRLGHLKGDPQIYRAVVYDKGAYVLHMLRDIVGEETFRKALTTFQERHRFAKVGTDDLREALEEASGRDLSSYFREWVYGTTLPELRWSHRAQAGPSGYRTLLQVQAKSLPGPVTLEVSLAQGSGRELRRVTLEPEGGSFTLETPDEPRKVEINANRGLLATAVRN